MNEELATGSDELQGIEDNDQEVTSVTSTEVEEANESTDPLVAKVESDEPPKKTGIQRRFQKYDAQLASQAQELEYWKKAALGQKSESPAEPVSRPQLKDFDSVEQYVEAREQLLKKELLTELERTASAKTQQASAQNSYIQKVNDLRKDISDWDEVMDAASDEPTARETVEFCLDSEIGPKIAYYLAKNPEVHDRLNTLTPVRRLAELGKLEDKLQTKVAKQVTKAPQKLTDVAGGSTPVKLSTDNPKNYTEWKKAHEQRSKR